MNCNKNVKMTVINIIKFLIVCGGLSVLLDMGTRSVFPLLLTSGLFILDSKSEGYSTRKERNASIVLALLYSVATDLMVFSNISDKFDGAMEACCQITAFVSLLYVFEIIVRICFSAVCKMTWIVANPVDNHKRIWKYSFLVIFVCLMLGLLLDYPGDVSKDSVHLIEQAFYDSSMIPALPPLMAIILRACFNVARFVGGDNNFGIFLYCTLQILFMSLSESYLVYELAKLKINKVYCYIATASFAIMPYNVQFSHTIWKDVPFAICCMIFMLIAWEEAGVDVAANTKSKILKYLAFVVSGIGMCILRTNGYYAFILFIPCGVILFFKKNRPMFVMLVMTFILAQIVQGPISDAIINSNNKLVAECDVEQSVYVASAVASDSSDNLVSNEPKKEENSEVKNINQEYGASGIYIITCQQLAAVALNRVDLDQNDERLLEEVFDMDYLSENYNSGISDNTMKALKLHDTGRYMEIWKELLVKYPSTYIAAWRDMTYGYWYPEAEERWVYVDELAKNDYGIAKVELLPSVVYRIREKIERLYKYIPGYGLFWSIGMIVWITAFSVALTVVKRGWKQGLCYMPIIGVWLTLLVATPVYGEFRYLYSFFVTLPLSLVIPYISNIDGEISNGK